MSRTKWKKIVYVASSSLVELSDNFAHSLLFQVHHGFYSAYHNTTMRPGILDAVKTSKEIFGDLKIIVTGHSMGGAMAAFCALDLKVITNNPMQRQL